MTMHARMQGSGARCTLLWPFIRVNGVPAGQDWQRDNPTHLDAGISQPLPYFVPS